MVKKQRVISWHGFCFVMSKTMQRRMTEMKEGIKNKLTYLGAGIGLVVFALYGLLPGSLIGGVAGLGIAGAIFGTPVEPGVVSRVIIAASMLTGVMVSGLIFVTGASVAGWVIGAVIETLRGDTKEMATAGVQ